MAIESNRLDPDEVIQQMNELAVALNPEDDYLTIVEADEKMSARAAERKKDLDETHERLRKLASALDAQRASASRPPGVPTAEEHEEMLNAAEEDSQRASKKHIELGDVLASNQSELIRLKKELRELEAENPAEDFELDGTALRYYMLKSLGYEPILNAKDRLEKVIVRGDSGNMYTIQHERGESDEAFQARLWGLASG
ncbi:hypothetical protein PENSPDRAFT_608360 [Peniophora sp. CONT]|nr:hypothetical protein PENSPDRAFT_608360 [Peniophora sp. CONT]